MSKEAINKNKKAQMNELTIKPKLIISKENMWTSFKSGQENFRKGTINCMRN